MKRSEINQYIREAKAFMTKYHFMLPPWADWTPDDWKTKGPECDDIRERAMGWDLMEKRPIMRPRQKRRGRFSTQ